MMVQKKNCSKLAATLNQISGYMRAIPKLTLLVHFFVVLIVASTIGELHHSGKSARPIQ